MCLSYICMVERVLLGHEAHDCKKKLENALVLFEQTYVKFTYDLRRRNHSRRAIKYSIAPARPEQASCYPWDKAAAHI